MNSAWDWAGIVLVASKDEARDVSERIRSQVRRARSTLREKYRASKEKLSHIWSNIKDNSDGDEDTTVLAHARSRRKKKNSAKLKLKNSRSRGHEDKDEVKGNINRGPQLILADKV